MMINKRIIKIDAEDFTIGKICRWQDFLFLFDITRKEMLQLSPAYETMQRVKLTEIADFKQIDTFFFHDGHLIIADSIGKSLHRLTIEWNKNKTLSISGCTSHPLEPGPIFTAAAVVEDRYFLLDKGTSMIRIYGKDFNQVKTIGSRMGYIYEYDGEEAPRLGFEYPEDMAIKGQQVIVSDSGNKRLVVLNVQGKQEKVIKLPEFPFKIIAWENDRVLVSDFDRSLMVVSPQYGFVHMEKIDYPLDFFPSIYHLQRHYTGSEKNELVELTFPQTSLESIAQQANNLNVLLKIKVDENNLHEARKLVETHKELLPEYVKYNPDADEYFADQLKEYIENIFYSNIEENKTIKQEISKSSFEFIEKYKAIPGSEDQEAANIDKENIRHRMFLTLKQYRRNLAAIGNLENIVKNYPEQAEVLTGLLQKRFETIKPLILDSLEAIDKNLPDFNEKDLLNAIVEYCLLSEEEQMIFRKWGFSYEKLFDDKFLLDILNNFYFNISELFRKRNKIDRYITYCDREITMYPDKMDIFKQFCQRLIQWKKYDDVLRMLKKFPDQNKENVNYFYYKVCLAKGDTDQAFQHLKKELDLYSHRVHLIPELIRLNKLNDDEVQQYIDKIMGKSGQSIDVYLNAAKSFYNIKNYEKAEFYLDRELELFPENKAAVILKLELLLRHQPSTVGVEYYHRAWKMFKPFMKTNRNEKLAKRMLPFFSVLNYLTPGVEELADIIALRDNLIWDAYKKEIDEYLSFMKHVQGIPLDVKVEKFANDVYLAGYSTAVRAYGYFFQEVKQLKESGKWEEMFDLTETILKYHPGDEKIFRFLDRLDGEQ